MTKEQFIEIMNKRMYDLFDIPKEQFSNLFSYGLIPNRELTDIEEIIEFESKKYHRWNEYSAIRLAGKMFTYGRDIVPISVTTVYSPKGTVMGKRYEEFRCVCCNFLTIDDAAFYIRINFDTADEYRNIINKINDFLETYTEMPDSLEFENYWKDYPKCTVDFN